MIRGGGQRLRDQATERRLFQRRALIAVLMMLLVMLSLAVRFGSLQIGAHDTYAARAEDNRIRLRAVAPNRGLIFDRHGRVLAENRPAYRLEIVPERTGGVAATLETLRELADLSDDEIERFQQRQQQRRPFERVPLRFNLTEQEVARLAVNRHRLPGVEIEPHLTRHYPEAELLAHVVGYVGRLDAADLQRVNADNYRASTHIGKTGIERFYEGSLHGRAGLERVETNAEGRVIRILDRLNPEPGENLTLTLDLDIQREAAAALDNRAGAVVVLKAGTGEVLALVSQPGFDPNRFVHGVSRAYFQSLLSSSRRPLFNRVLAGGYEPGSTIKPFIALAGLQHGVISPETRVFSGGYFQLPGQSRRYRDWRLGGHGWVTLEGALEESVNVYFYQLAVDLGIDRIEQYLAAFGFGQATGIDLPGEVAGILPSRAWKRATLGEPWYPGETVITGIGQGFTVVTPLQLAQATAILAAGAAVPPPHLLGSLHYGPPARPAPWAGAARDAVVRGMEAVMHGRRGTAREAGQASPVRIAGKTGTSQVYGRPQETEVRTTELPEHLRNHALFSAFAPADDPEIVIAVVVEHGGGGAAVAAPVAARVIQFTVGRTR